MMAVGAFDVLKKAVLYNSLNEAIEDVNLTVATSSGRRRSRTLSNLSFMVNNIIELARNNRVAIVFGHERNGLRDDELALCNKKVRIETQEEFPSMNLAQAVCAVAYALNMGGRRNLIQPSEVKKVPELPTIKETEELLNQMSALVDNIEFSRSFNKGKVLTELKDAFERMTPTKRECSLIKGVLFNLNKKFEVTNNGEDG